MAAKMTPLPTNKYLLLLSIIIGHSLLGGYYAATRPEGAGWRFFSWHPFLMMVGTSLPPPYIYFDASSIGQPDEKKENE